MNLTILISTLLFSTSCSFTTNPFTRTPRTFTTSLSKLSSSSQPNQSISEKQKEEANFPVLHRIAGVEWNGVCRYANEDLRPAYNLKLVGGLRYDLSDNGTTCTLSSFLTFPNGQTREVVMKGVRKDGGASDSIRLDSTAPDGGPIYMILTELAPDTVLINEVEKLSGKVIMTSSLSIVNEGKELVQVSHEVGSGGKSLIEGHQVWRLKQVPIEYDDFATRDTTGR